MSPFGDRLRLERERAGLTQPVLAERCGVTMRSQRNYEKGERSPDAEYLTALAAMGLDVQFVLTGVPADARAKAMWQRAARTTLEADSSPSTHEALLRGVEQHARDSLSPQEVERIAKLRRLLPDGVAAVDRMLDALPKQPK
jgi:transcriptional regulator with XRE-family HTH domain